MTSSAPFRIAIIDDDRAIRKLVSLLLARSGYDVFEATNATDARQMLHEKPWDLAVLDRRLPDLDGAALCDELKAIPEFRTRYIILLTGEDDERDKVEGLDRGADDYVTKPFQPSELLARVRAGKRIVDLQKDLLESNRRLELLSITDGLTQLYNHRHFQEEIARTWNEALRYTRPLSLAIIDLDFFKKINDTYGHAAGDQVLREVSQLFASSVRSSDLAARYGGEEFAVMMPETTLDEGIAFAEKVRSLVEGHRIVFDGNEIPITVSIGVANYPQSEFSNVRELIEASDRALYRAKRNGRNRVCAERRVNPIRRQTTHKKNERQSDHSSA